MLAELKKIQPPYCAASKVKRYGLSIESDDAIMYCLVRGYANNGACYVVTHSIPLSNIQGACRTVTQRVILCIYATGICVAFLRQAA
jgi:hypothetical protein